MGVEVGADADGEGGGDDWQLTAAIKTATLKNNAAP